MGSLMYEPKTFTAVSASDLSAYAYVFVKFSATSTDAVKVVELCSSGVPCGILVTGDVAGRALEIIPLNGQPAKLVASTTISVDAAVTVTTGGQGVASTSNNARIYFIATEAATATNDVICGYTTNMFYGA